MQLPSARRGTVVRTLVTTAIVLCLSAAPAAADVRAEEERPGAREAPAAETVMATESAARVGIERSRITERNASAAMQPADPATRWLLIIGISALAIALIVILAD